MAKKIIRVVSRACDGELKTKEYDDFAELTQRYEQIGLDDCSTDLSLRGMPLFRGLIGPIAEAKNLVLYESPDVFEFMTKEWSQRKTKRRRRSREELLAAQQQANESNGNGQSNAVPIPKIHFGVQSDTLISMPTVNY
jgi:hypothetical protein